MDLPPDQERRLVRLIDVRRVSLPTSDSFSVFDPETSPWVYETDGGLVAQYASGDLVASRYNTDAAEIYRFRNPSEGEVEIVFTAVEGTLSVFERAALPMALQRARPPEMITPLQFFQAMQAGTEIRGRRSGGLFEIRLDHSSSAQGAPATVIQIAQAATAGSPMTHRLNKEMDLRFTMVAMGDSAMAGFQSGTLLCTMQVNRTAPFMHERIKASDLPRLDPATFPLPLVSFPGVPKPPFDLTNPDDPTAPALPGGPGSRMNPEVQAFNLAVPDFNLEMILTSTIPSGPRVSTVAFETARVVLKGPQFEQFRREQGLDKLDPALGDLGVRAPQVAQAKAISPSLVLVWGGTNDWIGALFRPDRIEQKMTSEQRFENLFEVILRQRSTDLAGLAFFTPEEVLEPQEPLQVRARVGAFNERIRRVAATQATVALVPVDEVFGGLSNRDRALQGGVFSADALHPNAIGHRLVAAEFIRTINAAIERALVRNQTFGGLRKQIQRP